MVYKEGKKSGDLRDEGRRIASFLHSIVSCSAVTIFSYHILTVQNIGFIVVSLNMHIMHFEVVTEPHYPSVFISLGGLQHCKILALCC